MTTGASPFLVLALVLTLAAVPASLLTDDVAPIAVAAPFALAAAAAVSAPPPTIRSVSLRTARDRLVVGQDLEVHIVVEGTGLHWVELEVERSPHISAPGPRTLLVRPGVETTLVLRAERWGGGALLRVDVCGRGVLGLRTVRRQAQLGHGLRIYPTEHQLRSLVAPHQLAAVGGQHASRQRGDGFEYAESRPYAPGDRPRDVNWRMTGRRGELWVDRRHPERAGTAVLFMDSFASTDLDRATTLAMAIEAGIAVARRHLQHNDRVGLVDLGGTLRWIPPRSGRVQVHTVVETLVESEVIETWADKDLAVVPAPALPPGSLVIALSALEDPRILRTLLQLRAHQYEVVVIECALPTRPDVPDDAVVELSGRLAALEREAIRGSLRRAGATVARWQPGAPLEPVLRQLTAERRRPHGVGA
jgi:uncharacterized protein (DUF58 family)